MRTSRTCLLAGCTRRANRATGSVLVGVLAMAVICLGIVASPAGAPTSKGETITITITPNQWYGIQHVNTNGRVMNASEATNYLFDFTCTTYSSTPPPTPRLVSQGSRGVTFRVRLTAKQVATLNKEIRNQGTCGKVHNVQQEYKSAYAEEVAIGKQVQKSAKSATTTIAPPPPTTVPTLTQQQQSAVAEAKQYLSTSWPFRSRVLSTNWTRRLVVDTRSTMRLSPSIASRWIGTPRPCKPPRPISLLGPSLAAI